MYDVTILTGPEVPERLQPRLREAAEDRTFSLGYAHEQWLKSANERASAKPVASAENLDKGDQNRAVSLLAGIGFAFVVGVIAKSVIENAGVVRESSKGGLKQALKDDDGLLDAPPSRTASVDETELVK